MNMTKLVVAAVEGKTLQEIAKTCGASVSTVQRRLKEPAVKQEITDARFQARQEALGRLTGMRVTALERLQDLVTDDDTKVVLRAVDLILRTSLNFDKLVDLDERLLSLEEQLSPIAGTEQDGDGHASQS